MSDPERIPTVVEALASVMDEVQAIAKDSRNEQQGFRFRGIDAVMGAVGPAFRNNGVVCVPVSVTHETEHYKTKTGTEMRDVTVIVGYRFYGPAGDYIDAAAAGEAADAGDKATPKAHSVAFRTLLLQALCIPTGDDDPDAQSHQRGSRPTRRVEGPPGFPIPTSWPKLEEAVRKCDNPEEAWALWEAFLRAATYHAYGKSSLKELTAEERKVMFQRAAGAVCWLHDNVQTEGPDFLFFDEEAQRKAWAHVLDGMLLEIPDYMPVEPEAPDVDEEAAQLARESFAADGGETS